MMNIQTTGQGPSMREFSRPRCPRCRSPVLVAEQAAFNLDGDIRHTWSCDECGNKFVTSVRVFPHQVRIDDRL
jgi:RNase P subunit RPR2